VVRVRDDLDLEQGLPFLYLVLRHALSALLDSAVAVIADGFATVVALPSRAPPLG